MHPTFRELFIETEAEDVVAEEDWRRRVSRFPVSPVGHDRQAPTAMTPGPGHPQPCAMVSRWAGRTGTSWPSRPPAL